MIRSNPFKFFLIFLVGVFSILAIPLHAHELSDQALLDAVERRVRIQGFFGRAAKRRMVSEAFSSVSSLRDGQRQILRHLVANPNISIKFAPHLTSSLFVNENRIQLGLLNLSPIHKRMMRQLGITEGGLFDSLMEEGAHSMLLHRKGRGFDYLNQVHSFLQNHSSILVKNESLLNTARRLAGRVESVLQQRTLIEEIEAKTLKHGSLELGAKETVAYYYDYVASHTAPGYFPEFLNSRPTFGEIDSTRAALYNQYLSEGVVRNERVIRQDFESIRKLLGGKRRIKWGR